MMPMAYQKWKLALQNFVYSVEVKTTTTKKKPQDKPFKKKKSLAN